MTRNEASREYLRFHLAALAFRIAGRLDQAARRAERVAGRIDHARKPSVYGQVCRSCYLPSPEHPEGLMRCEHRSRP